MSENAFYIASLGVVQEIWSVSGTLPDYQGDFLALIMLGAQYFQRNYTINSCFKTYPHQSHYG